MTTLSEWELVKPKGGKMADLHVTGHSMVYYEEINALILFGGKYSLSPEPGVNICPQKMKPFPLLAHCPFPEICTIYSQPKRNTPIWLCMI